MKYKHINLIGAKNGFVFYEKVPDCYKTFYRSNIWAANITG